MLIPTLTSPVCPGITYSNTAADTVTALTAILFQFMSGALPRKNVIFGNNSRAQTISIPHARAGACASRGNTEIGPNVPGLFQCRTDASVGYLVKLCEAGPPSWKSVHSPHARRGRWRILKDTRDRESLFEEDGGPPAPVPDTSGRDAGRLLQLRERNHPAMQRKNLVDRQPLLRDVLRETDVEGARRTHRRHVRRRRGVRIRLDQ